MTTHARYERAARAVFDFAYPAGYGEKLHADWPTVKAIATGITVMPTLPRGRAKQVVTFYRALAQRAIEA